MKPRRIEILGVPVDCVSMQSALDYVDEMVRTGQRGAIIAVNPEKVMKARRDPALLAQLRSAALLLPDGIGIVWAARWLGLAHLSRVAGADLMVAICERAVAAGHRLFLYGASRESNQLAAAALRESYPGIAIVGTREGYVPAEAMPQLIADINASRADILFVALGSPRQEVWMSRHLAELSVKVCQGVGGTFDVLAGVVRRAPEAWRARNLEWAYRLMTQPRRLPRQTALPSFAWQVIIERVLRRSRVVEKAN